MNQISFYWMPLYAILVMNVPSNVQATYWSWFPGMNVPSNAQANRGRGPPCSQSCALYEDEIYPNITGCLTSPNYPSDYENNYFEQFLILGSEGQNRITLTIDDFELEPSNNCVYDYLEISDLTGRIVPTKFCGTDLSGTLSAITNHMLLKFSTDSSVVERGFKICYTIITEMGGPIE